MGEKSSRTQKVLSIYGIVLFFWSIYRWKLSLPSFVDEFFAKPLVFLLPAYIFLKRHETKSFLSSIRLHFNNIKEDILIGIALGMIFVSSALLANFIRNDSFNLSLFKNGFVLLPLIIPFATAFTEEAFSRGFILREFFKESKNAYTSSFNASILFLILHIPVLFTIPELRGNLLLLFLATDFILSLVNSLVFIDRDNLIAPILIHAFYNLAILLYI